VPRLAKVLQRQRKNILSSMPDADARSEFRFGNVCESLRNVALLFRDADFGERGFWGFR
jgi:hypothetical protein